MKISHFITIICVMTLFFPPSFLRADEPAKRGVQIVPKADSAPVSPGQAIPQTAEEKKRLEDEKKRLEDEKRRIADEKAKREKLLKAVSATPSEIGRDGRFIAYDNGTVLDTQTHLMWAAKDNGANINWQEARIYCNNYSGGGYTDWRMPTQDELAELYDVTIVNTNPPADGCGGGYHVTSLIHLTCCCSWASDMRGSMAAYFGFSNGPRQWLDQTYASSIRVLPVRSDK